MSDENKHLRQANAPFSEVESLLNAIPMVDVNVDIQHPACISPSCQLVLMKIIANFFLIIRKADNIGHSSNWPEQSGMSDAPLMHAEELQYGQHDVVDVAKARGLCLLSMVHAACASPRARQTHDQTPS